MTDMMPAMTSHHMPFFQHPLDYFESGRGQGCGGAGAGLESLSHHEKGPLNALVQQRVQEAETEREQMRLQVKREDVLSRTQTQAHDTVIKTETQKEIEVLKAQLALVLAHINKTDLKEANAEAVERAI